jgi:hypothetical protein
MTHLKKEKKVVETAADLSPCLKPGACVSLLGQGFTFHRTEGTTADARGFIDRPQRLN